jgi:hypothetical protein
MEYISTIKLHANIDCDSLREAEELINQALDKLGAIELNKITWTNCCWDKPTTEDTDCLDCLTGNDHLEGDN